MTLAANCRRCGGAEWLARKDGRRECYTCNRQGARERMRVHRRWHPELAIWQRAKHRARRKGVDFRITLDDIVIPERCPVLGIVMAPGSKCSYDNSPSIDRLDASKGYVRGNIRIISSRANRLKSDGSPDEHEAIAAWQRKEHQHEQSRNGRTRLHRQRLGRVPHGR